MIDIETIDFGGNVRRVRKARNLTCADVDRMAGLGRQYTDRIERRGTDSNLTMVNALSIANALGVSIMELLATPQDVVLQDSSPAAVEEIKPPAADKPQKQGGSRRAFKKLKELTAERLMVDEMACVLGKGCISYEERLELKRVTSKMVNEVIRLYGKGELG
ncbi:MAG: helix-turn-helix domain-containing protein [Lachnospiraceae bacterium]|nr:helix-turn-helix domain-containing protein [Lachnospiraceae bacterium]